MGIKTFVKKGIILFLLSIIIFNSCLLESYASNKNITFNNLNIEQGISQSTAEIIFQDSKGYIWIGTSDGLNRYNGYEYKIYNYEEGKNSISHNGITDITEDDDGYCVEPNIGFCPLPSGMSVSWDREKYPYLSLLDNSDLSHVAEANDEETMQTHFTSMLSYIQDHDDILSMMGQTTDSPNRYQDMINFVQKNGLKIHGFAVSAKKKALLELYKEDVVSYIQTTPQN